MPEIAEVMQMFEDLLDKLKSQASKLEYLTERAEALQKRNEEQHEAIMKALQTFRAEMHAEFAALRAEREQDLPAAMISKRIH